jgi:biotin operon repressor
MTILRFEVGETAVPVHITRVVLGAFTGRNREAVARHIAELRAQGIECPSETPVFYELDPGWVTQETRIPADSQWLSGEAEPALVFTSELTSAALVTVASDVTDRALERVSIPESKRRLKPLAKAAWQYGALADRWDELALRSWIADDGHRELYQSGSLGELLHPADLVQKLRAQLPGPLTGLLLLMGTLPLIHDTFRFSPYFCGELVAPDGMSLSVEYMVERSSQDQV